MYYLNIFVIYNNIVMIYIEQNQENKICLTLTESSTITDPYYLFVFQNEFNKASEPILWVGTDTSLHTDRYNLFLMDETTSDSFNIGQYTYTIYESETLPIIETGLNAVEEGRMVVSGVVINSIYEWNYLVLTSERVQA